MKDRTLQLQRLRMAQMAGVFLVAFFLIRSFGGKFGNSRGWPRHDTGASNFMEFFIVCKYPPDLAYATITLAVDFLLILFFTHPMFKNVEQVHGDESEDPFLICHRHGEWGHPAKPILVFGRAPLFFYICHFYVIGTLEALCRLPEPPTGKFRLEAVFLVWCLVISVMFFICRRFVAFKQTTPIDSLWRLL